MRRVAVLHFGCCCPHKETNNMQSSHMKCFEVDGFSGTYCELQHIRHLNIELKLQQINSNFSSLSLTSCRQPFKEMNILILVSLYIMEVICYIRKHHQFVDLNSNIHAHNTQRKMDIHIQSYNTDLYKRSVIDMGNELYNKLAST